MNDKVIKKILDSNPIHCKSSYGSFGPNVLPRGPYLQYKHHNQIEDEKKQTFVDFMKMETYSSKNVDHTSITSHSNYHYINTLGKKTEYNGQTTSMSQNSPNIKVGEFEVPKLLKETQTQQNNDDNQQEIHPHIKHVHQTNIFDNNYSSNCHSTRTELFHAKHNGNSLERTTGAYPIPLSSNYLTELVQTNVTKLNQCERKCENSLGNMHKYSQTSVTTPKYSTEKTENFNFVYGENNCLVSLSDILLVKSEGLKEDVGWAILCQSVQALQDMFLSDNPLASEYLPILKSSSVRFTLRGRIVFEFSKVINEPINHHLAPEYLKNQRISRHYSELDIEKMWIYSLGLTLHEAIGTNLSVNSIKENGQHASNNFMDKITSNSIKKVLQKIDEGDSIPRLQKVIKTMCEPNPYQRASIMTLLNVITSYFRTMQSKKPVSHLIMDLLKEVNLLNPKIFLLEKVIDRKRNQNKLTEIDPIKEHNSPNLINNNKDLLELNQPQIPKRKKKISHNRNNFRRNTIDINLNDLAKATKQQLRYKTNLDDSISKSESHLHKEKLLDLVQMQEGHFPNVYNCPEFILKLSQPSKLIKLSKSSNRQRINVILVNSENIEIICDYSLTTISDIFEAIVEAEKYSDKFMLGLCSIIGGDFIFLPSDLKLIKIFPTNKGGYSFFTLFLRVKFLLPTLQGLSSLQTRHMLYLQLRKSIIEKQLHCHQDDLITLAGLALQAEVGDFTEMMQYMEYFVIEHYIPESDIFHNRNIRKYLINAHYLLKGMTKLDAEQHFIQTVQKMKHFGYHLFSANWVKNMNSSISIYVGISLNGIALFERNGNNTVLLKDKFSTEILRQFEWLEIQNLSFSKENLCITIRSRENLNIKDDELIKFKIELKDKKSNYAFNLASEHHKFYLKIKETLLTIPKGDDENILTKMFTTEKQNNFSNQNKIKPTQKNTINKCLNKFGKFLKRSNSNVCNTKTKPCEHLFSMKNYFRTKQKSNSLNRINIGEVFENQNNENECTKLENKLDLDDLPLSQVGNSPNRNRVKMGTRVFSTLCLSNLSETFSDQCHQKTSSIDEFPLCALNSNKVQNKIADNEDCESLYDTIKPCESNEAYVIHSSIISDIDEHVANNIAVPINETISESILESIKNHIFTDRILKSVTLIKQPIIVQEVKYENQDNSRQTQSNDKILTKKYTLGISIVQGSENNNVYVKDLLKDGPGEKAGVKIGDQIIAVDGVSILNLPYSKSLQILQKTNFTVELVVSQIITVFSQDTNMVHRFHQNNRKIQIESSEQQNISQTVNKTIEAQYATVDKKSKLLNNGTNSRKYSGPVRYPVTPLKPYIQLKL